MKLNKPDTKDKAAGSEDQPPIHKALDALGTNPSAAKLQGYFQSATYITSAAKVSQSPADTGLEVAFAGRSNAGKSSAINRVSSQKKLARTSKTPGRTQLLNFFGLNDGQRLVDLPGYGFAKVSMAKKLEWQKQMQKYLEHRDSLAALILLIDSRHPLQDFDQMMLDWAKTYEMRCHILLTKADKLSRSVGKQALFAVEKSINKHPLTTVQLFSATSDEGLIEARRVIFEQLHAESTTTQIKT